MNFEKMCSIPSPKLGFQIFFLQIFYLAIYRRSANAGSYKIDGPTAAAPHILADSIMLFGSQYCISILQRAVAGKQFHLALLLQLHEFLENLVILAVGSAAGLLHLRRQREEGQIRFLLSIFIPPANYFPQP